MLDLIVKIVVAIITLFVVTKYLQPVLLSFFPPFGLIILVLVYLALVAWLLGKL